MIYIFKFILLLFFINLGHSSGKCSLNNVESRSRPSTDTYALSPSGHFRIHYDLDGSNAPDISDLNNNNIPDYIDEVGLIADSSRYVLVDIMNFMPEIPDSDEFYDIYVQDRPSGYYGVNFQDDNIDGASYIIIDNAYEPDQFLTSGINTMRLTVAHEFFHAIQRAYRTAPSPGDVYFWEMSATWIEDIIVPDGDDYLFWVEPFFNNPEQDISETDGYSIALFGHYLSHSFDSEIPGSFIKDVWEKYSEVNNAFYSIDYILTENYNADFSNAWLDFNSKNLFNGIYNEPNDFYFYQDQQYLPPISTSINFLNQNSEVDLIFSEESAAFKTFYVNDMCSINLQNSIIPSNSSYNGKIISVGENSNLNFIKDTSDSIYIFNSGTYIHLAYSGYSNSIITANINFNNDLTPIYGDLNLDQEVNVMDVVIMVELIFNNISLNDFQLYCADVNLDDYWNIFDVIMIVDIIIN